MLFPLYFVVSNKEKIKDNLDSGFAVFSLRQGKWLRSVLVAHE
jgi:hypothetical protein